MSKPQTKTCGHCRGEGYVDKEGLGRGPRGGPAKLVCKQCGGKGKVPVKR